MDKNIFGKTVYWKDPTTNRPIPSTIPTLSSLDKHESTNKHRPIPRLQRGTGLVESLNRATESRNRRPTFPR